MKRKYFRYDVPRANCCWCGKRITVADYWFFWLRHFHRKCLKEIERLVREDAA